MTAHLPRHALRGGGRHQELMNSSKQSASLDDLSNPTLILKDALAERRKSRYMYIWGHEEGILCLLYIYIVFIHLATLIYPYL